MKKILILIIIIFAFAVFRAEAQYGFGTNQPNPQAIIDLNDPAKGMLVPRVLLTSSANPAPFQVPIAESMLIYNTANVPGDISPGFYYWNGLGWKRLLVAGELTIPATNGTLSSTTLDVSGGSQVLESDVTINLKGASKWFYMPGVPINTQTTGTNFTLNLYTSYTSQFSSVPEARNSTGADASIPVYAANELDYFVVGFDNSVFNITDVSSTGVMTYDVISNATACSFINVVFVIK